MSPERWQAVKDVFDRATRVPPPDLPAFLEEACEGDATLRREVESLLESDGSPLSLLEPLPEGPEGDPHPAALGPYRLLHRLGAGGMSEVFLGVRSDDEYHQRVAVKWIRRDLSSREALDRFRRERQILAGLEHPNIARLLDGGTTAEGRPFLVMEYVEGLPIDQYCRRHGLGLRQRLALFRPVCRAVQHAHRNLVVHRDLKPGNVLVSADGSPKLLDFGVAKLLNPELSSDHVSVTAPGLRALTLGYASPEQVAGEPVTTASDVYSLGVMLFELLVGERPHRLEGLTPSEAERRIRFQEAPLPSKALADREGPPGDGPGLNRDLDAILLMALSKEPARRYGSAAELEEDIARHLRHEPVRARPATFLYRAIKLARRHRFAAVLLLALTVFFAAMAVQTSRLSRALEDARRQGEKAEQISDFLVELFEVTEPLESRGRSVTAVELLERGRKQATGGLETQPLVRAAFLDTLGRAYRRLGLFPEAEELLLGGLHLRREVLGEGHPETATSLGHLAQLRHGQARLEEAEELARKALEVHRRHGRQDPLRLAASHHRLGEVLHMKGDYGAAGESYREALELRRRSLGEEHPVVAESLSDFGYLLFDQGRFEESEQVLRQALELSRRVHGGPHLLTAYTLSSLAFVLEERGDLEAAEPYSRESLAMHRTLLGEEHPDTATAVGSLGTLLLKRGRKERGEELVRQALELHRKTLGEGHPLVGTYLVELARALKDRGDLEGPEPLLHQALGIFRRTFDPEHPALLNTLELLADLHRQRGSPEEARTLYQEVYELRRKTLQPENPQLAFSLVRVGLSSWEAGDPGAGEPLLREASGIVRGAYLPGDWRIAYVESEWAGILLDLGRDEEAAPLLRRAVAVLEASPDRAPAEEYLPTALRRLETLRRKRPQEAP